MVASTWILIADRKIELEGGSIHLNFDGLSPDHCGITLSGQSISLHLVTSHYIIGAEGSTALGRGSILSLLAFLDENTNLIQFVGIPGSISLLTDCRLIILSKASHPN